MAIFQMIDKDLEPSRLHAIRFGLWIAMASILMMFAALTSAYIVRKAAGNWYEFKLPVQFFVSTLCILASSFFMERSYKSLKSNSSQAYKSGILLTFIFGIAFLVFQVIAWKELFNQGITLDLNVSGSFLYALSGLHAFHVLGGVAAIIVTLIVAYSMPFEATKSRVFKMDLVRQYWHFVDLIWIYLLIFLILQ